MTPWQGGCVRVVGGYRQKYRGNNRQARLGCSPCIEYQKRSARLVKQRGRSWSGENMEGEKTEGEDKQDNME